MKTTAKDKKTGAVLVLVMVILVTCTLFVSALLQLGSYNAREAEKEVRSAQALWVAEAGIQQTLGKIYNGTNSTYRDAIKVGTATKSGPFTLSIGGGRNGEYMASVFKDNNNNYDITVLATVLDQKRRLHLASNGQLPYLQGIMILNGSGDINSPVTVKNGGIYQWSANPLQGLKFYSKTLSLGGPLYAQSVIGTTYPWVQPDKKINITFDVHEYDDLLTLAVNPITIKTITTNITVGKKGTTIKITTNETPEPNFLTAAAVAALPTAPDIILTNYPNPHYDPTTNNLALKLGDYRKPKNILYVTGGDVNLRTVTGPGTLVVNSDSNLDTVGDKFLFQSGFYIGDNVTLIGPGHFYMRTGAGQIGTNDLLFCRNGHLRTTVPVTMIHGTNGGSVIMSGKDVQIYSSLQFSGLILSKNTIELTTGTITLNGAMICYGLDFTSSGTGEFSSTSPNVTVTLDPSVIPEYILQNSLQYSYFTPTNTVWREDQPPSPL